jgi:hypothetical protein
MQPLQHFTRFACNLRYVEPLRGPNPHSHLIFHGQSFINWIF